MKKVLTGLLIGIVSTGMAENEWKPLFNGRDLSGWTFDVKGDAAPETIWQVADGTITVNGKGKPAGVIRTEKNYSNYTLEFEWRWPNGKGNSGCLIHTTNPRNIGIWPQSIEVQLMAENAGDFWQIGESIDVAEKQIIKGKDGKPSRRRLNLTDDSEKPIGEWNQMRIIAKGATIEVYVNNTLVNKGWNSSVSSGAICLQAEGANIHFRNIRIRKPD